LAHRTRHPARQHAAPHQAPGTPAPGTTQCGTVPMVHPDLERLIRLQALDTQAADARKAQTSIPETQQALDQKLEGARSTVAAAKEKQAAKQGDRAALEK